MEYLIEVDARFTRTYRVVAKTAERALEIYQTGEYEPEWVGFDSADEEGREAMNEPTNSTDFWTAEELGDTAVVYSADGTHTMLIDVADAMWSSSKSE
jgi:hypothetical protein